MSNDWDDKPIGYKQPPVWTRFAKGKSGNPRGRPKKPKPGTQPTLVGSSELDDALRKQRNRLVKVNGGDGPQDVPMFDVLLGSMAARAAKGDVHAQKAMWGYWRELELRDEARKQAEAERQEKIFKYMVHRKAEQAKTWAQAERTGAEPDAPWPHPDDVIVNHDTKTWRIRGPFDKDDVPFFEYLRAKRDANISSLALKIRTNKSNQDVFFAVWVTYDVQLPKRWQNYDRAEAILFGLLLKPLRELRALNDQHEEHVGQLRKKFEKPWDKETYRTVNAVMKPLLKQYGYRSLAQFEKAYELHGDAAPMNRRQLEYENSK